MSEDRAVPTVSVLMPAYDAGHFVRRAIESLAAQTFEDWELVIVDDGSGDDTAAVVQPYLATDRISLSRLDQNAGLGAALNHGFARARATLIAYLPADDVFFPEHLETLVERLAAEPEAVLAYSGARREHRVPGKGVLVEATSTGQIDGYPLQLVQVLHRATDDRWTERDELVTDDLDRMLWTKLRQRGPFVATGQVSCEWTDHPLERHKLIREPLGGINPYRRHYGVREPLRFHSTTGNLIDEVEHYRAFRERPDTPPAPDGLKILLVGELAFNAERVLALEERGHRLYGLWTPDGHWFNTVGPVPFGHVHDLPARGWREAMHELRPDVIYALLNWEAVPFAHEVMTACPDVPFVWHFKESPFDCIANGTWRKLVDLYSGADGTIFSSPEMRNWVSTALGGSLDEGRTLVLDGDLPKRDWFTDDRSPRLSESDGEVHTVVAGGPIGLVPPLVGELASRGIHLHFYGDFHRGVWSEWVDEVRKAAPGRFHLHGQVNHDRWVSELSQYDAGWLHLLTSDNDGDIRRARWGDLNYPARIPTLASAGVPSIQLDNRGSLVATQSLVAELDIGLFCSSAEQLAGELHDEARMAELRANVWRERERFTFDFHADRLIEFFRRAISAQRG